MLTLISMTRSCGSEGWKSWGGSASKGEGLGGTIGCVECMEDSVLCGKRFLLGSRISSLASLMQSVACCTSCVSLSENTG